jgi:hypothetical protein
MAITTAELKQMQRDIAALKKQVARLERRGNGKQRAAARAQETAMLRVRRGEMSERERALAILRRAGVTREITSEEERIAARWDALPDKEKREVEDALRRVRLDPPLSQLIHEMRR